MPDPFVSDVQFQCTDGSGCTHITAKCNGVNNCAVGTTPIYMLRSPANAPYTCYALLPTPPISLFGVHALAS